MEGEIPRIGKPIEVAKVDPYGTMADVLGKEFAIYMETLWMNGRHKRVASIHEIDHPDAAILGYGVDAFRAERALVKALAVYNLPKDNPYVGTDTYVESSRVNIDPSLMEPSRLDVMVGLGRVSLRHSDNMILARFDPSKSTEGVHRGKATTALGAMTKIADKFPFRDLQDKELPVTVLTY